MRCVYSVWHSDPFPLRGEIGGNLCWVSHGGKGTEDTCLFQIITGTLNPTFDMLSLYIAWQFLGMSPPKIGCMANSLLPPAWWTTCPLTSLCRKHSRICCSGCLPSHRHWVCFCLLLQYYGAPLYTWLSILIWGIRWSMRFQQEGKWDAPYASCSCLVFTQSPFADLFIFDLESQRSLTKGLIMKCSESSENISPTLN